MGEDGLVHRNARRIGVVIVAGLALVSCVDRAAGVSGPGLPATTSLGPPVLSPSSEPVIHEYVEGLRTIVIGLHADEDEPPAPPSDSTRVWADGRFVCVRDGKLREGRVDPAEIDALLHRLHREGAFGDGNVSVESFGPDAPYDVIDVRLSDRRLHLASWHGGFEHTPGLVGTARGIESLGARDRESVLAEQPPEYQRFRRTWADIRSSVESWVRADAAPVPR